MFFSSSDEAPEGTPPARKPFFQLAAFPQQLHNSGLPLVRAVQYASNNVATSLLCTDSGRRRVKGEFNFGAGMEGGVGGSGGPQVG